MKLKCKHCKKSGVKGYVICDRDGSRRKATPDSCQCPYHEVSLWRRLLYGFSLFHRFVMRP